MKRPIFIGFLLFLALAACTKSDDNPVETRHGTSLPPIVSPELSAIDSLMWQQPDSALTLLQDYLTRRDVSRNVSNDNDTHGDVSGNVSTDNDMHGDVSGNVSTDAYENHYAQLLAAELLYKNDYAQTNRAELLQAVAYYDSLVAADASGADTRGLSLRRCDRGDASNASVIPAPVIAFLDARAHYINGVGYYEQDSVVQACKEYLTALETMENHFEEKDLVGKRAKFMALTHTHLTTLFSDCYLHEQAIYFARLSLAYYKKYDATPWHIAWTLNELGSHYEMMEQLDSADCYYRRALVVAKDSTLLIYRDIATHQAFLSYKKDKNVKNALSKLHELSYQAESEREFLSCCAIIGEIFYHESQNDSAWVYLNKVFRGNSSFGSKKQAAEWLVEICKSQGRDSEILEYADFLVPFANMTENQSTLKSQMTKLTLDFKQERQEALHRKERERIVRLGGLSMAILVFVALLLTISHFSNKKRQKHLKAQKIETEKRLEATMKGHMKELEEKETLLNHATAERKKAEHELKEMEMQHSAILEKARNSIKRLQEENKDLNERIERENKTQKRAEYQKEDYEALTREGIYRNVVQRLKNAESYTSFDVKDYASLSLTQKEMKELYSAIERHCPDFSKRLKVQYPELNIKDLQLCRLYLLDLTVLQTAILLGTDYSSVRKRTNRLKKKMGSNELCQCLKLSFFKN